MRSVISLPSFLPCIHRSLSCPALKLISVCLCRVQKSQAVLAQNHTRTHSLALNPRLLFERLGATRQLVGWDPGLEARRWNSDGTVLFVFFKMARRLVLVTDRWSRSVFSSEQDAGKKLEELTRCLSQKRGTMSRLLRVTPPPQAPHRSLVFLPVLRH